jgi:large subunit ribosomal protein L30
MPNDKQLNIQLTKSPIGYNKRQRLIVQALGLRKFGTSVTHYDSPTIRGMINKIPHLLTVTE